VRTSSATATDFVAWGSAPRNCEKRDLQANVLGREAMGAVAVFTQKKNWVSKSGG